MNHAEHYQVAGWGGVPGECGVECACGTVFDGFDSLADAAAILDDHAAPKRVAPVNRGRVARASLAGCVGLVIAALWIRVAVAVSPWVAVGLLAVAVALAVVVGGVMAASGTAVVRHAEQTARAIAAIESARRREISR